MKWICQNVFIRVKIIQCLEEKKAEMFLVRITTHLSASSFPVALSMSCVLSSQHVGIPNRVFSDMTQDFAP